MDPPQIRYGKKSGRLPRPCGDGPPTDPLARGYHMVTSPMRGWTHPAPGPLRIFFGYPAHAGMDPPSRGSLARQCGLPRPCGDGPCSGKPASISAQVTPPMRGWTSSVYIFAFRVKGYPAHAGMDPKPCAPCAQEKRLPRPCGDGSYRAACQEK